MRAVKKGRLVVCVCLLAIVSLSAVRFKVLNDSYPHDEQLFELGQEVVIDPPSGTEGEPQRASVVSFEALDGQQTADLREWSSSTPLGSPGIALRVTLTSEDADIQSLISSARLTSGPCAWGPDQQLSSSLYYRTGGGMGKPRFDLVFLLDPQTCSDEVWKAPADHGYELVYEIWPTRKAIELGRPEPGEIPSLE